MKSKGQYERSMIKHINGSNKDKWVKFLYEIKIHRLHSKQNRDKEWFKITGSSTRLEVYRFGNLHLLICEGLLKACKCTFIGTPKILKSMHCFFLVGISIEFF